MVDYATFQEKWDKIAGKEATNDFARWKNCSGVTMELQILRIESGFSEKTIADRLGWTPEQVFDFEMAEIQDVHFNDMWAYLNAIGFKMGIRFMEKEMSIEEDLEFYASNIYELLKKLVEQAGNDPQLTEEAVKSIYKHSYQSMSGMLVKLIPMFQNQNAVMETLEEILPPQFRPSRNLNEIGGKPQDYREVVAR